MVDSVNKHFSMVEKNVNADVDDVQILVVDDELAMLESLEALMHHYGYQVETALGGTAAIEKLASNRFDILLLDIRMPEVDGHAVMEFMSAHGIDALTIIVSGETSYAEMSRALRNGGYDYLKKPYAPEELIATVNNAIRKKRLENDHRRMEFRVKQSEKLHRFIVNNSPDIIFMLNANGRFDFLNSKIEALLGYDRGELLGKHISSIVDRDDLDKAQLFFKHIDYGSDTARSIELSLRSKNESRSKRFFEVCVWPVTDQKHDDLPVEPNDCRLYCTARDITERKEAEAYINFQAYHDLLTRLPNRALFKDRLSMAMEQARRHKTKLAVMFLDLDRFKIINDTLGHTIGDQLLQAVSLRLTRCLRRGDTLSRFGGDEFTLLLPELIDEEAAEKIAIKIISALKKPFLLAEHEIYVGASIGIVLFPGGGTDIDSLIQNADIAMYQVKDTGKDSYAFYSRDMNAASANRLHFERDIRRALENDEFVVHFQPQHDAVDHSLVGVEALLRWEHPEKGVIYPGEFIGIAEETRLIMEIDRLVLQKSCREVKRWHEAGFQDIRLSVNFSPMLMENEAFVDEVLQVLDDIAFPRNRFEIEITENVLLSDLENMVEKLVRLKHEGIRVAIDDFGTGYSSLSYLQKFPIHTLKIDQSFVQDICPETEDVCIVNAIVSMAHGLKLNIVAEGVETEYQLNYLKRLGCQYMQGYYFSRAVSGEDILAMMINPKGVSGMTANW